jgi:molybdenum cofactor cytidylyltransferase
MIPILILAAGASTRMRGRDKLLELVDGMPLLRQRALAALAVSPQVYITLPAPDHPRGHSVQDLPLTLIPVPDAAVGMSASLQIGVASLPECNHFMVLLADLPDITSADMTLMITQTDAIHRIFRGTSADGIPGHPIIFDSHLRPLFADLTGDTGAKSIIGAHQPKLIALPGQHATRDLDTPEDWANWRAGR